MISLEALEVCVRRDLELTAHPRAKWLAPHAVGGEPALDVLVVGAGQSGLATGFALLRDKVENILLIDKAPRDMEGPWSTYARMPTLRSTKDQNGPDLGMPSLTFQAWFEAQWGAEAFVQLDLIPKGQWHDYLRWFRDITGLPVRNDTALRSLEPGLTDQGARCIKATSEDGHVFYARKVILATGQDGTGRWWMPSFVEKLPPAMRAHTCDHIDFESLRGRTVAVLGAGASAFDNAATALEHGAIVHLFCRRAEPMVVQPYRWLTFAGFMRHIGDMTDAWRWRILGYVLGMREGFPPATYDRVQAFSTFTMHVGAPWTNASVVDGRIRLDTLHGPFIADFAICGTGVVHDFAARPELSAFANRIARWSDRYTPPAAEESERLGGFPYLAPDYAFTERNPGEAPWLRDIHLFGIGATLSFGPSASSINAMTIAVPKLVAGITRGLFEADIESHWAALQAYDVKQVELDQQRLVRS
ncbi:NAD(P)/FAD-dependent oxidoreductase [Lichenicola cladoniae]|uniref:NAD(P)/FAD-dependent oxidoreductase n=1 Tax=Lichenicola cladoniae TaxID=1484109 RepID=A0A6M8HLK4_9PROT|nr:NAD(P)/FAD-dependent oxidoreductase [Lichenicola cladoniae]NPD66037.1 NAD(P)/FAD-dependent oxidoreductase [Acetobacteraceae bacterium]QKE89220.1 NAD(P)/FAD-dependent oxidoreductase [Lichenicola cladoniae]